jgi:hypothetical protein
MLGFADTVQTSARRARILNAGAVIEQMSKRHKGWPLRVDDGNAIQLKKANLVRARDAKLEVSQE